MNQREALIEVGKRVSPILSEFGLESYVLMGYIRTEEKSERFVAVFIPKDNPLMSDAMRQVATFGAVWASPDPHQQPPESPEPR